MNGCDEPAGPGPEHSPVARDVKDLDPMESHEARKEGLMPEDVVDRRSKTLGYGFDAH